MTREFVEAWYNLLHPNITIFLIFSLEKDNPKGIMVEFPLVNTVTAQLLLRLGCKEEDAMAVW